MFKKLSHKILLIKQNLQICQMDIKGKAIQLLPLVTGQGKNGEWRKQDFLIEIGDQYPKKVILSLWGDKIDQNPFAIGDEITVSFDVESREYNGKWYTDLRAWKIQGGQAATTHVTRNEAPANTQTTSQATTFNEEQPSDDLPF